MAKFKIYSPAGTEIYEGTPSFTGQYMAPGLLEFREIASPVPLDLVAGCYVDYTRTGFRYRIYGVPQVKKQARQRSYGGAFMYQNVQLYDASKMLEYCPFRDIVKGDNRIHFSTQPSISTFEGVDGLARRFEACLQDQYGENSWRVRVATTDDGISQDLADLMADAREFTVSGVNILECLNKVYEIWPEVGWVYTVENGIDTIIIGGAGLNANEGTYAYGKGFGLTALTRTVANADEMANRIFAYGSSRNMLPRWYNNQTIKDAESVDIQNLMIPVSSWGTTDGLPDASKAFVENAESITKMGLRPSTVYFDRSGEYPEIYPSIREATIGKVREAIGDSTAKYYPSTAIYSDPSERVDKILFVPATFDSGKAGENGQSSVATSYGTISAVASGTIEARNQHIVTLYEGNMGVSDIAKLNLSAVLTLGGTLSGGFSSATISIRILGSLSGGVPYAVTYKNVELQMNANGEWVVSGDNVKGEISISEESTFTVRIELVLYNSSAESVSYSYSLDGGVSFGASLFRSKTFTVRIPQVGFDIGAQAALGDGKTISMRSGSCVGRTFAINSVQYNSATDDWTLECFRSEDESLSQWFPNTDYPVQAGDEFVLLDIAMPEIYIGIAEQRLLDAARELLADTSVERWQYVPEIDAKYMVENNRTIRAGEYMVIKDGNIIGTGGDDEEAMYFRTSSGGYFLTSTGERILVSEVAGSVVSVIVDTVVINEGDAAIPTYKVTLRDRKRKTWTESESAPTSTSKSVGTASDVASQQSSSGSGESFWTLDDDGNVTLKPQYENAWVPGWLAAGGVGSGSGGGGGIDLDRVWQSLTNNTDKPGVEIHIAHIPDITTSKVSDINTWIAEKGVSIAGLSVNIGGSITAAALKQALGISGGETPTISSVILTNGTNYSEITVDDTSASFYTKAQTDALIQNFLTQSAGDNRYLRLSGGTVTGYVLFGNSIGGNTGEGTGGWNIDNDGSALFDNISASYAAFDSITIGGDSLDTWISEMGFATEGWVQNQGYATESWVNQRGFASASDLSSLASRVTSIEDWFEIVTVGGQPALHVKQGRALYSDSWIAAGGVGSGSGGGSGTYVAWGTKSGNTRPLTVEGTTETLLLDGALSGYATQSWVQQQGYLTSQSIANYVTLDTAQTISGAKTFSANLVASANLSVGGVLNVNGFASIDQSDGAMSMFNSGARASKTFNAYGLGCNLRACDANGNQVNIMAVNAGVILCGSTVRPNYGSSNIDLGGTASDARWRAIYGVNADLTGNLSLSATSYIDIGPLRIEYDATNKALHITKNDSTDTETYGLYADGFIAAGGVQQSA